MYYLTLPNKISNQNNSESLSLSSGEFTEAKVEIGSVELGRSIRLVGTEDDKNIERDTHTE